jgi:uncharacterized membrane protein YphA (DoxX/SURF4 family)
MASAQKDLLDLVVLLNRVALGLFFLLAGAHKISDGVGNFYHKVFLGLKPGWLPTWFAAPYGHLIPFAEVTVGVLLILGLMGRLGAALACLLLTSFTIALAAAHLFFTGSGPFHTNVIFLTLALLLAVLGPGSLSADAIWRKSGRKAI